MKYSIITVNYNNRNGLKKTIESVVRQTYRDFEYIVIDGGSTDGSVDILKEYNEQITYWVSEPDKGIYNAMNKGIAKATGEYLIFMNSGDRIYNQNVLQNVANMDLSQDIIIGRDYHFNSQTKKGFATILPRRISMITLFMQALPHQSTFYKRLLFENFMYDESLKLVADHKFNIQKLCLEDRSVSIINEIICFREPGGASDKNRELSKQESKEVFKQLLPIGVVKDYKTLSCLDRSTVYKFLDECENEKARKLLTFCIKAIYRLIKCNRQ